MGNDSPTPTETGEDLIKLINDTAGTTGESHAAIADILSKTTGIKFKIQDGKLNITESALIALDWKMAYARAKAKELELLHKEATTPEPAFETESTSSGGTDTLETKAAIAGYTIPTEAEERRIREKHNRSNGSYRDLHSPVWNDLKLVTGTKMFSEQEVENFVHGVSLREIFQNRCSYSGRITSALQPALIKGDSSHRSGVQRVSLMQQILDVPWYVWIGGFCAIIWLLATFSPKNPPPERYLTKEEQIIEGAVKLQRFQERRDREMREKYKKEYQRQEREGK